MGALDGLKVADFTWAAAGPLTTKYLADYGATVVKIESPNNIDQIRAFGPFKNGTPGLNRSTYFAYINANKISIGIDLSQPAGIDVAKKLIAWADVVAENFRPGVMERLGLGYDEVKRIRPDVIMFRMSGQGQTGPYARFRSLGFQLVGLAGFTDITGWADEDPAQPFGAYTDLIAPRFGAVAIIAALDRRRRTGEGQCIDLSQLETGIHFLAPLILDYSANQHQLRRRGNACEYAAPHNVYPCLGEERWCAITVFSDQDWQALCRVIENPSLAADERFRTLLDRKRNEAELDMLVESWTRKHTAEDVMNRLQAAGIAAGVAQNAADLWGDPQLAFRNQFWRQEHPAIGPTPAMGQAFIMSRTPAGLRLPAPCLGEHSTMICKDFLKMPEDEIAGLFRMGVLQRPSQETRKK